MASSSRSWEGWAPRPDAHDRANLEEDPPTDWKHIDAEDACAFLADYLIELKLDGKINATHVCIISLFCESWWLFECSIEEPCCASRISVWILFENV